MGTSRYQQNKGGDDEPCGNARGIRNPSRAVLSRGAVQLLSGVLAFF